MAQSTKTDIAPYALWLKVTTLNIKGYLLKARPPETETTESEKRGKQSFLLCSVLCVAVSPLVALEENSL